MDIDDPARALVVHLKKGAGYDAIALGVEGSEGLAERLSEYVT